MVAACEHFTSSAWICSVGLLSARASSDSSRLRLTWRASDFCAPGRTMIVPSKIPRDRPSSTPL